MRNRYILQRLIEWLNKLSDSELKELSSLFSEPEVRTSVLAIIDNALALRHIEGKHKSQSAATDWPSGMPKRGLGGVLRGDVRLPVDHSTELKQLFFEVFEDTSLFPSRRDMLDVMNKAFNCGFEYREHKKRGRKDLVIKCWNKLKNLPRDEQRKKLKAFVSGISESKAGRDDYKELFRLLVNHE